MAPAKKKDGDIVSEYPRLVGTFVVLQCITWVLSLLESFGALGAVTHAVNTQAGVTDFSICQMMFFGTLHNGLLSDKRLAMVCRIAFVVDGVCYFITYSSKFRPSTIEQALNFTATGEVPSMLSGFINASIWLFMLTVVSAWFGIRMLEIGRLRLFQNVERHHPGGLAGFSDRYLKIGLAFTVVQLLVLLAMVVVSAAAQGGGSTAQIFHVRQMLSQSFNFTMIVVQLPGTHVMVFEATGATLRTLRRWGWAALVCMGSALGTSTVLFVSTLFAGSSPTAAAIFDALDGKYIALSFMVLAWCCQVVNFGGLTCMHFVNLDRAEARCQQRSAGQASTAVPSATSVASVDVGSSLAA